MQHLDLKISVSDSTIQLIDAIRTTRSREDLFIQMIELGLSEILETAARVHRESAITSFYGLTQDLKLARNNLLSVRSVSKNEGEADNADILGPQRHETIRAITSRTARS